MTKSERDDLAKLARKHGFIIYDISYARDVEGLPLMTLRKASHTYVRAWNGWFRTKALGDIVLRRANAKSIRQFLLDRSS